MMPSVNPSRSPTSTPARCSQRPSRTSEVRGESFLTSASRWAKTPSATEAVLLPGVMTTGIPRRLASATSTRSVPTPVLAMTLRAGMRSSSSRSTRYAARTIAASAVARSSAVGSWMSRWFSARSGCTRSGSTLPRATKIWGVVKEAIVILEDVKSGGGARCGAVVECSRGGTTRGRGGWISARPTGA
jgi:hypothetical protein